MNQVSASLPKQEVICALATPPGIGAIALVRVSGPGCLEMLDKFFRPAAAGVNLSRAEGYTVHYGWLVESGGLLDQVLVTVFRAPHSYTGEDAAEIGLHGSLYIQQRTLEYLSTHGARLAEPGEFTLRAFLNGKVDLSQAEAVADLIASQTPAAHQLALEQMRGDFSRKIGSLRRELVDLAALLELELDFSGEDVEFADRARLLSVLENLKEEMTDLIDSFSRGNVMKHGIPVAIAGMPNVGKSTLLNALLNEERALVSEVAGTTRDYIEDVMILNGTAFRFIDTAGLRHTVDRVESLGIGKAREKISQARIILYVFDISLCTPEELKLELDELRTLVSSAGVQIIPVANKTDLLVESPHRFGDLVEWGTIFVSAKRKENINLITERLKEMVSQAGAADRVILSNVRHYEALQHALQSLLEVESGLTEGRTPDLVAVDLRNTLHYLGTITGQVLPDEILGSVFSRFCIGK